MTRRPRIRRPQGDHGGTEASAGVGAPTPVPAPQPIVINEPGMDFGDAT